MCRKIWSSLSYKRNPAKNTKKEEHISVLVSRKTWWKHDDNSALWQRSYSTLTYLKEGGIHLAPPPLIFLNQKGRDSLGSCADSQEHLYMSWLLAFQSILGFWDILLYLNSETAGKKNLYLHTSWGEHVKQGTNFLFPSFPRFAAVLRNSPTSPLL